MRCAKLTHVKKIEITEEPFDFTVEPEQAVVQVKAAGICGTDLHIFAQGRADVKLPRVLGHELAGVVVAVGENVAKIKKGDHVVLDPVFSCGTCRVCRRGRENICSQVKCFGVQMDGGFQDYIKVDAKHLYTIPGEMPFEEAALAEPYSVAANILARAEVMPGDRIVILGAGTIGLCILQAAKRMGCEVMITDIEPEKLKLAAVFGADYSVNTAEDDVREAVYRAFQEGADVVIDAVGKTELLQQAMKLTAPGGHIGVIAFDEKEWKISPAQITRGELLLSGSRMNCRKFPEVIRWMRDGKVNPRAMITAQYPLEKIQEAFENMMHDRTGVKTILRF